MQDKITYIIPLHVKDKRIFRALSSTPLSSNVIVSAPIEVQEWLLSPDIASELKTMFNLEGDALCLVGQDAKSSSYPALVNEGIKKALELGTDWISILEYDDELQKTTEQLLHSYIHAYDDADILTPLSCIVKTNEGEDVPTLVGMANEAAFANGVTEEFGYYDLSTMLKNNFVFVNGCYIKSDVFTEVGMFKENFTVLYDYEWILRAVYQGKVVRAIPRATHFHYLNPDGAFEQAKSIIKAEGDLWLKRVKTEYFYEEDRAFTV